MALLKIERKEYLHPDKDCAVVHRVVKLFGVPLFEDSNISNNENVLDCFRREEEGPRGLYDVTEIGFKQRPNDSD